MTGPRLEDHALGVELQLTDLVERIERARVQGREDLARALQPELVALQDDLARTAETLAAGGSWGHAEIHLPRAS